MSDYWYTAGAITGQSRTELTANQERALAALLTNGSVEAAARACGLSERTIRRYLADENFNQAYGQMRDRIIEGTVSKAGSLAVEALDVHAEVMRNTYEESRVRLQAARAILDAHLRSAETERRIRETGELEQRLQALEEAREMERNGW